MCGRFLASSGFVSPLILVIGAFPSMLVKLSMTHCLYQMVSPQGSTLGLLLFLSFFLSFTSLSLGQTLVDEVDSLFIFMTMAFGCTGLLKLTGMMNCPF